jgi:signal transduction histidine kinase
MMRSVAIRLSLFYLAIIMALSIGFSVAIYSISSHEITQRDTPPKILTQLDFSSRMDFQTLQTSREQETRQHLQRNLIFLNVLTLVVGAPVCYLLARRTLQPIEEAFAAQGRFTADASHELRTPLTAMQTTMEVGLRNPKLTLKDAKDLMGTTLEEVKKLSVLSNGLLKLTRSDGKAMPKEPVEVSDVIAEAVDQLSLAATTKDIAIQYEPTSLTVLGDAISLKEVIVILLDNAIKYSSAKTTVTIKSERHGKFAYIAVTDQGQGMKESDAVHIFERFYRADISRSRERIEGYGLGLSIAKKIVEAHNGTIEVHSKIGEGSTFLIRLPLAVDPVE